ncbi:hypothetical protein EPO15_05760 [bacterium]|nr:MAG: hypothetical protein EPO15_05760 [bacterium]
MRRGIPELLAAMRALEAELAEELEAELERKREQFSYSLRRGEVDFERRVRELHKRFKTGSLRFLWHAGPLSLLVSPLIYSLILPLAALDLWVALYQAVCFRVYGIERAERGHYMVFDRTQLPYLNAIERLNCAYCSYANGLVAFVREVASRTEQYFCPIKHAKRRLAAHDRYAGFVDFGDAETFRRERQRLRDELAPRKPP